MGGVIIGHEMGRALGVPAMFVERPEGVFGLRRGFRLDPGARCLMVEDVVTTGLSSREAIAAIEAAGGKVVAAASLVDRSGGSAELGVPFTPLIRIDVPTYSAEVLPAELAAIEAVKPGSRAPHDCWAGTGTAGKTPPRRQHRSCRDDPERTRRPSPQSDPRCPVGGCGGRGRNYRSSA